MKSIKNLATIVLTPAILGSCSGITNSENQAPRAIMSASTYESIYSGNAIFFDGSRSYDPNGEIVKYKWDFGDGYIATGTKANHKYDAVGHFVACLEVTDNEGATSETCVGVNVLTR